MKKLNKIGESQENYRQYGLAAVAAISMLLFPAEILHFLAVVAHTIYESLAFAVEELLTHVFHFSKFQAQMIVFYSSCAIAAGVIYRCARRFPGWLAQIDENCRLGCVALRARLVDHWQRLPAFKKFQLLLVQFAVVASSLGFMLA